MRSVFSRPTRLQVLPASIDLQAPRPTEALLRTLPSPVPTQTMSGLPRKIAIEPMAWAASSSKTGFQVRPPFSDFHTPPVAAPA